jgi:hypothetical protein
MPTGYIRGNSALYLLEHQILSLERNGLTYNYTVLKTGHYSVDVPDAPRGRLVIRWLTNSSGALRPDLSAMVDITENDYTIIQEPQHQYGVNRYTI